MAAIWSLNGPVKSGCVWRSVRRHARSLPMVLGEAGVMMAIGIGIGVAVALLMSRAIGSLE